MAQQFPILSFSQANPGYAAAQSGMSLADQLMKLKRQDVAMPYQKPTLEEELKQAKFKSLIDAVNAQYAPEEKSADIASTQAKTQWLPYQAIGAYASGLGNYTNSQYNSNPSTSLFRTLATPQGESLYEQNPQFASAVADSLANTALQAANGGGGSRQPINSLPSLSSLFDGSGQAQMPNMQQLQMGGQGQQRPSIFSPQDIAASQAATGNVLTRRETPTAILNQQYYSGTLDKIFDVGDQLMPSVAKYAGISGKGKKGAEALGSAFGYQSPEYENYRNFTQYVAPTAANDMRRVLGGQATDAEMKMMDNLSNPTYWDSNPKLAMKQWNFLTDMYRRTIGTGISRTPTEVQANARQIASSPAAQSNRVRVKDKNGKVGTIPANQLNDALKEGYVRY